MCSDVCKRLHIYAKPFLQVWLVHAWIVKTLYYADALPLTGGFLEFLVGGMAYPDEPVKSSVVYILVQICSRAPHGVSLPLPLVQSVCRHISTNLASGRSHDLTVNLLGTYGRVSMNWSSLQCLLQLMYLRDCYCARSVMAGCHAMEGFGNPQY